MDINQRKLQIQSESMHIQDGEEPGLSLSSVGKTEKEFAVDDIVNSNTSQCPSTSGAVPHKMKRDSVSKSIMINLQAHGYNIIDSNI